MNLTAIVVNSIAGAALIAAAATNRRKTLLALKAAVRMFRSMLPMTLLIIVSIGLLFALVPEETLGRFLGDQAGPLGTLAAAVVGAVLHIPALLSFPLAASLLEKGASVSVIAAFVTTLTMIGMVSLPLEIKTLGRRFALLRNGLSFAAALLIAVFMGVVW